MSTILELLQLTEAKNHMGEKTYASWDSWKKAIRKAYPEVWFDGDKDIANAMIGAKPYKQGSTHQVGEWDGNEGCIHNLSEGKKDKKNPADMSPTKLYNYVLDVMIGDDDEEGQERFINALRGNSGGTKRAREDAKQDMLRYIEREGLTEGKSKIMDKIYPKTKGPAEKSGRHMKAGYYVFDEDGVPVHGPFDTDRKAEREAAHLNAGKNRGFYMDYLEAGDEVSEGQLVEDEGIDKIDAWKAAVKKAHPDVAAKLKFKANVEDDTLEACISGQDRLYGVFDLDKERGQVLGN
jgi:hypothetical protein